LGDTANAAWDGADPAALLRGRGVRVTAQRRLTLQTLLAHAGRHWPADEIWAAVRRDLPEMARGTAYKVLDELVRVGLAEEMAGGEGMNLYGLRLEPHHHFVCDGCGRWFDIRPRGVEAVALDAGEANGYRVRRVEVTVRGLCPECAARTAAAGGEGRGVDRPS
jgi:Fe2+ or Zn2+ uptake regulation protein